jgi:hypothetical protein
MRLFIATLVACLLSFHFARAEFAFPVVGSLIELQPFAVSEVAFDANGRLIEFTNVNPNINTTFFLSIDSQSFHMELRYPQQTELIMTNQGQEGVLLLNPTEIDGEPCTIRFAELEALSTENSYTGLCNGLLAVRFTQSVNRSTSENVTTALRNNRMGWFVEFAKNFVATDDAFTLGTASTGAGTGSAAGPLMAQVKPEHNGTSRPITRTSFQLSSDSLPVGGWVELSNAPGVYFSQIVPGDIANDVLNSTHEGRPTNAIERQDLGSAVNLVAFDLSQMIPSYHVGSEEPRLTWSSRPFRSYGGWNSIRNQISGPDGFSSPAPFVRLGVENPWHRPGADLVAHFTAGFLREHGAFRWGNLVEKNHGSHYGMIENGVVLSRLMPGLATFIVYKDGHTEMKTWDEEAFDPSSPESYEAYAHIQFARQNGVPLVETLNGQSVPGELVHSASHGNWSGNANAELRSMRSALCLQESQQGRFLIYAHFSSTVPSVMARTLMGYHCQYAIHLDMNSYNYTYAVVYGQTSSGEDFTPGYLVTGSWGMEDDSTGGTPRYLQNNVSRDRIRMIRRPRAQ